MLADVWLAFWLTTGLSGDPWSMPWSMTLVDAAVDKMQTLRQADTNLSGVGAGADGAGGGVCSCHRTHAAPVCYQHPIVVDESWPKYPAENKYHSARWCSGKYVGEWMMFEGIDFN